MFIEVNTAQKIRFNLGSMDMFYQITRNQEDNNKMQQLIHKERISSLRLVIIFLIPNLNFILNKMGHNQYSHKPKNNRLTPIRYKKNSANDSEYKNMHKHPPITLLFPNN